MYKYYVLFVLFLIHIFSALDGIVLGALIEPIKHDLLLTDSQAGLLAGLAFFFFYALFGMPIARWADKGNRRNILVGGMVLWSGMTVLSSMATSFTVLGLVRIGVGIGEATCFPCAMSLIADYFEQTQRPRAVAIFQSGIFFGIIGGTVIASAIANLHGWRTALMAMGIPGIAVAVLLALTVREPVRGTQDVGAVVSGANVDRTFFVEGIKQILTRNFTIIWLGVAAVCMGTGVFASWGSAYMQRTFGVSVGEAGAALGPAVGLSGIIGTLGGGAIASLLARRYDNERYALLVPATGALVAVPGLMWFLTASTLAGAGAAIGVANLLISTFLGPCIAMALSLVRANQRALAAAILLIAWMVIGNGLGPLIVGLLSDALAPRFGVASLHYAMWFAPATVGVGGLLFFAAFRFGTRQSRVAPA
jgi:predicted MFS family arabinose efflux permease